MKITSVMLLAAIVVFLIPLGAHALCTCTPPPSASIGLEKADAVFTGTVKSIHFLQDQTTVKEPKIIVTFNVQRSWKRPLTDELVLHTVYNTWTCNGFPFEENKDYLVYAHHQIADNTLYTNRCSRTELLSNAQLDLEELGIGLHPISITRADTLPTTLQQETSLIPRESSLLTYLVVAGSITLVGVYMYTRHKKRRSKNPTK